MTVVSANAPVSAEALCEFESRVGRLPDDYRQFITAHNGIELETTASLRGPEKWPVAWIEGIQAPDLWLDDFPKDCMPIASDGSGNTYLMVLSQESRGHIYFFDHEQSDSTTSSREWREIAASFADFIALIQDFDPNDPDEKLLFQKSRKRRQQTDQQRQAILNPIRPWWRFW